MAGEVGVVGCGMLLRKKETKCKNNERTISAQRVPPNTARVPTLQGPDIGTSL